MSIDRSITQNISITNRPTRQANCLRPPNYVLGLAQGSVFYKGVILYNEYVSSPGYQTSETLSTYKANLKKFVFNKPY